MSRNVKLVIDLVHKTTLFAFVVMAVFLAVQPLQPIVSADPLPPEEIKALNFWDNWVADACNSNVSGDVNVDTGNLIPDDQIPGRDPREKIWNYLIGLGLKPVEAAGIVGNIGVEGVYDPTNIEDPAGQTKDWDELLSLTAQNQGYGLIGFTPGRSLAKGDTVGADWSQISGIDVNKDNFFFISTQLSVVYGYMKNSKAPSGKNMFEEFRARSTNPGNAALAFEDLVENPGVLVSDKRIQLANDAMRDFGGNSPASIPQAATGGNVNGGCGCPAGDESSTGSDDANLIGKTNAERAFNYYVAAPRNLPPKAAAGLVGNFMEESGGNTENLKPAITNSIGAHGIAQWLGGRRTNLQDFARSHGGTENNFTIQLDFSWSELTGSYSSVLAKIKQASSPAEAADIVNSDYEVSGVDSSARQANARMIFAKYGGNAASGGSVISSGTCQSTISNGDCPVTAPVYGSINGSGNEYSQEQLARIFGDPGTASNHPEIDANLRTVDFLGNSVQIHKLAAPCLEAVAEQIKSAGVNYKIKEMGCYRYDSDNGSSNIGLRSYHTYGIACDINWSSNPYISGGSAPYDMPMEYVKAFRDHGFTWGGDWVSVKDYMHFEFNGIKP